MLARTPFQHMGMQNIRRVSRDAQYACEAPAGLVIQPVPEHGGVVSELGFATEDVVREAIHFNPYPLMLACGIEKGGAGFRVCASFDGSLIAEAQMGRVLAQLEAACVGLAKDMERGLDQVSCLPAEELDQIWDWNRDQPLALDSTTGRLETNTGMVKSGSIYNPRAAIPWVCDLRNPAMLAPIGCPGELWLEGTFLAGDSVVESPAWLVAGGRQGKVQPTGDIVKLQEDGRLVFVGRKDTDASVQGHGADPAELEVHLTEYLPSLVRSAVAAAASEGASVQKLVVFVEQRQVSELGAGVNIISQSHDIVVSDAFAVSIRAEISTSLVGVLKRLDKFVQNSLASHLVPSAYVVIDNMPTIGGEIDRTTLQQLASKIPRHILDELRAGFQEAWKANLSTQTTTTTASEDILRSCWAAVLGLDPEQIDTDDNFFRLGGDSVLAMKLVSRLRAQGHGLTVADIFRHMRLGDAAKVLKVNQYGSASGQNAETAVPPSVRPSYQAFSMLGSVNAAQFVAETVTPQLGDSRWSVQDVYPVTDSQALDVRATVQPPRTSIQYTMLYSAQGGGFDRARLLQSCKGVVQAHDILRTVFIEHKSALFQVVLKELDIPVTIRVAENEDLEVSVNNLCTSHIESGAFRLGSPFFHLFLVQGQDGQECLVIGLSHAQYDGVSLPLLLRDLELLYIGNEMPAPSPFSSYIAQIRDTHAQSKALSYWGNLLSGSSLSLLPGQSRPSTTTTTTTKAIFHSNPIPTLSQQQPAHGDITTATLLTAAWSLVLARRLRTPDVTFGNITSGRAATEAETVMGPCYQFTPVRVPFQRGWTARDLLQFVQRQGAEALAWDFVGVGAIAERVGWRTSHKEEDKEGGVFFDSVVHHQDWEDFDVMPFAGKECKVGILNPHGDAAYPLKVVSFVKGEEMHVGVVGSEEDVVFVDEVLGELTAAVGELAGGAGGVLMGEEVF
jgi:aryl carrier-like protein